MLECFIMQQKLNDLAILSLPAHSQTTLVHKKHFP